MRSVYWAIGFGALGVIASSACSSSTGDSTVASYGGSSGASGSSGSSGGSINPAGGASGSINPAGGASGSINPVGGASGAGAQPNRDACAGDLFDGQQKPLDMFIMYDQSGSMGQNNNARWDAVGQALTAFLRAPQSAGIGVGIGYFPLTPPPCTMQSDTCLCILPPILCIPLGGGSCTAGDYARPEIPIEPLPGVADKIITNLGQHAPGGGTPTLPALSGAVQYATSWAQGHPDHKTIVVLATDGQPEGCNSDIPGVSQVAAQALAANPSIQTFVIGVGNTGNLNAIAQAGGTTMAYLVSDQNAEQAFLDAMNQIRGISLACDYAIPLPQGRPPNFNQVNFYFTPSNGQEGLIYKVGDVSQCDPSTGGWYYDNPASPTQIRACPATCDLLKGGGGGSVKIEVGCDSIRPPT
jgi:hypothetical protein